MQPLLVSNLQFFGTDLLFVLTPRSFGLTPSQLRLSFGRWTEKPDWESLLARLNSVGRLILILTQSEGCQLRESE